MVRYTALNRQLRLKRQKDKYDVKPISEIRLSKVEEVVSALTPEELREGYANPISSRIPIKMAYTVLQRLCDENLRMSLNTDYLRPIAFRMYGG